MNAAPASTSSLTPSSPVDEKVGNASNKDNVERLTVFLRSSNVSNPLPGSVCRTPTGTNPPTRPTLVLALAIFHHENATMLKWWGIVAHIVCSHLHLSTPYLLMLAGTSPSLSLFFFADQSPRCSLSPRWRHSPPNLANTPKEAISTRTAKQWRHLLNTTAPKRNLPRSQRRRRRRSHDLHAQHDEEFVLVGVRIGVLFFRFSVHRSPSQCLPFPPPQPSSCRPHAPASNRPNVKD